MKTEPLPDDIIAVMREERLGPAPQPTYRELGKKFGLHYKTVRRICLGLARKGAGGPIEPPPDPNEGVFDLSKKVRCSCGALVHPLIKELRVDPDLPCAECNAKLLKEREAGVVPLSVKVEISGGRRAA
jgi:hypothetical protein